MRPDVVLLVLDLAGTFAFALNGALTAMRAARIDIVGVLTLASITAIGGGILRDVILGAVPPATFMDWRYLAVAAAGGLLAFFLGRLLASAAPVIELLDAAGLSLFAVTGALKALEHGVSEERLAEALSVDVAARSFSVTTPLMFLLFVPFYVTMFLVPNDPDSTPASTLSSVVLPHPFSPSRPTTCP